MEPTPAGRKPKSAAQIRDTLANVHELAERTVDVGPHAAGLQATDRIAVATFADPECARAYQDRLLAAGIHSDRVRRFRRDAVQVDLEDRGRAAELLEAHLRQFPDRRRRLGQGYEASLFFSLIGVLSIIVVLLVVGNIDETQRLTPAVVWNCIRVTGAITLHLACVGLLIDLVKARKLNFERGQFNLIFMLWLMTAVAMLVYWQL